MQSGTWRIILESSQIAVQRTITLTVGVPQTVVATVCDLPVSIQDSVASTDSSRLPPPLCWALRAHRQARVIRPRGRTTPYWPEVLTFSAAVLSTITQTVTLIVLGPTVTSVCDGHTKTVTDHPPGTTVTVTSTVVRTTEEGEKTSFSTTTVSATAFCHYPSSGFTSYTSYDTNPAASSAVPTSTVQQTVAGLFGTAEETAGPGVEVEEARDYMLTPLLQ